MAERINHYLVREISEVLRRGRILDIPCGGGELARSLHDLGFRVTASDLFPETLDWPGHPAVPADMNEPLPFPDDAFDGIVSQEGIEHLENLPRFFRECRRILRPGGVIWLTTPNFMDLSGRAAYFLAGMKSFRSGYPNEDATAWGRDGDRLYHGHAFTLPFFQIRYLLRLAGFGEVSLHGLGRSGMSILLYPVLAPITRLLVRHAYRIQSVKEREKPRTHARAPSRALQRELDRHARSPALLCHRKICIRATAEATVDELAPTPGDGEAIRPVSEREGASSAERGGTP